ncbi:MAG: HipA N-terminal domain-containing protein [Acidimicrobiaceae bacterium]|nr:HipA N-terminal domain-containing protein [Acidimicrobiaceae bacterium]
MYVWVWLPGAVEPVVAGRLDDRGAVTKFTYGRSYLDNPDAMALYLPDLPLERGEQTPRSGTLPGCVADAAPDAWGRRVIEYQQRSAHGNLPELA